MTRLSPRLRWAGEAVLVIAVFAAALAVFFTAKAKIDSDEGNWIGTTRYFETFFIERDFSPRRLGGRLLDPHPADDLPLRHRQLALVRGHDLDVQNPNYDYSKTAQANRRLGLAPADNVLDDARMPARLMAALAVTMLYLVVRVLAGPVGGLAAAISAIGSPYLEENLIRAKAESTLMFFLLAALLLAMLSVWRPRSPWSAARWGIADRAVPRAGVRHQADGRAGADRRGRLGRRHLPASPGAAASLAEQQAVGLAARRPGHGRRRLHRQQPVHLAEPGRPLLAALREPPRRDGPAADRRTVPGRLQPGPAGQPGLGAQRLERRLLALATQPAAGGRPDRGRGRLAGGARAHPQGPGPAPRRDHGAALAGPALGRRHGRARVPAPALLRADRRGRHPPERAGDRLGRSRPPGASLIAMLRAARRASRSRSPAPRLRHGR